MKKISLFVSTILLLITGCSSLKHQGLTAVNEEHGAQWEFSFDNKFRVPASIEDQPSITELNEQEFQKIIHSNNFDQFHLRLQLRLDAIEEVYFRAKQSLMEFDSSLKESSEKHENSEQFFNKIIGSGVYSNLLALRENNLTRQRQLIYFLKKFQEVANNRSSPNGEVLFAKNAFEFVGSYYLTLPRHYLVAHYQIALELNELKIENNHWNLGIRRTVGMKRSDSDTLVDLFTQYHENYETDEVESQVEVITKKINALKTSIGDEVKKSAYMIQVGLMNAVNLREPQALKIEPSTGSNGNITGNSFPKGVWAITYDDGPHPKYTNEIVNNLKEFNIKSTFFSLSKNVLQYPQITKGIQAMGMEIANHSHDHAQLPKLNDTQLDFQILSSTDKISSVTGEHPRFFRCPYGAGTNVPKVRSRIAKEDMIHVFWSVDSLDWQDHNPASIVERVKKQMALSKNGGGIILFHDIHPQSVIASKEIMKYLKDGGPTPGKTTQVKTIGSIVDMLNN